MRLIVLLAVMVLMTPRVWAAEKMNVLFIVSDDLCNVLGYYGNKIVKTPNLDKLAARGVRFDRAYCQYPLCNPSRASFMNGLRPDTTKVYDNSRHFRQVNEKIISMPQTFRNNGYVAARVGKLYHYGVPGQIGTDGLDDKPSWDKVVNPRGRDKDDEEKDLIFSLNPKGKGSGRYGGTLSWLAAEGTDEEQTDALGAEATIKLIKENKGKAFFIACGFYRPHTPFVAPKKYFTWYPLEKISLPEVPKGHREAGPVAAFASSKVQQENMSAELKKKAIQAYYASVSFMDAQLGKVVQALEEQGLAKNTIITFCSDHGYHLAEHGLWQKMSLFENSARVPLLIYDPRVKGNGRACGRTVELCDLHATLADLCGLPEPKTDGKSLKPLLDDPDAAWDRPALTQVFRGNPSKMPNAKMVKGYSLRTERYRYTEWNQGQAGVQLFDYEKDPLELKNLAQDPAYADVVAKLKRQLRQQVSR